MKPIQVIFWLSAVFLSAVAEAGWIPFTLANTEEIPAYLRGKDLEWHPFFLSRPAPDANPKYSNGCARFFENSDGSAVLDVDGLPKVYKSGVGWIHPDIKRCTEKAGHVVVEDSEAALACRQVGGSLPTREEILALYRTPGAKAKVFSDVVDWFWTSEVSPTNIETAFALDTRNGTITTIQRNPRYHFNHPMICVRGR